MWGEGSDANEMRSAKEWKEREGEEDREDVCWGIGDRSMCRRRDGRDGERFGQIAKERTVVCLKEKGSRRTGWWGERLGCSLLLLLLESERWPSRAGKTKT